MKNTLNIWWKFAIASATLDILTLPVWMCLEFDVFGLDSLIGSVVRNHSPLWLIIPISAVLTLPVIYLIVFIFWHWHTRYVGQHQLAWPILFAVTIWPLFKEPGCVLTALLYFFLHVVPDIRCKGAYVSQLSVSRTQPQASLPKSYQLAKSACFVLGWSLVIGGLLAATIMCVAHFLIWNRLEATLPGVVGTQITDQITTILWLASQIGKITGFTSLLSVIAAAIGAALIQVSQRMRWRLLDEQEKEELRKSIL